MITPYESITTFTRRPALAQIITYLVFLGEGLTFFICMYINYIDIGKKIVILVLYVLTMAAQILLTLVTSCSDPSDDVMIQFRNGKNRVNMNLDNCLYCDICASYVQETSRHCKVCQRCVQDFDHHCMWINNCIGSKNYKSFMAMTIFTLLNMIVYIAGMVILWVEGNWMEYLGSMVTIWVFGFIIAIFLILLLNLVLLHFYLIYKGITTYQFIMMQRQEQRAKQEKQQQKKQIQLAQINKKSNSTPVQRKPSIQKQKPRSQHQIFHHQQQQQVKPPIINESSLMNSHPIKNEQQNSNQVIFGNNQLQNKTEKSEQVSQNNERPIRNIRVSIQKQRQEQQEEKNQDQEPSSLHSRRDKPEENLSQFFTKNKSLKFFIGDEIGSRPKSARNQSKLMSHQLYQSARIVDIQPNNQHHNENISGIQLKANQVVNSIKMIPIQKKKTQKKR